MSEQVATKLEGLQIWMPSDNFSQNYNLIALQEMMSGFGAISLMHKPGEDPIYCSGGDKVVYHTVSDNNVNIRLSQLAAQSSEVAITSCVQPDQAVEDLKEEARLRELHLGLGRTGLFLAIGAETETDFSDAAADLIQAFSVLTQPIHTLSQLESTVMRKEGLIYMFVQAARRHKSLTPKTATELAEALNKGILPLGNGKSWYSERGKGFADRVGFAPKKLVHPKTVDHDNRRRKRQAKGSTHTLRVEPEVIKKPAPPKRTKAEVFVNRLFHDRRKLSYSQKLAAAHSTYTGKDRQPLPVREETKLEVAKLGIEAYLEAMSDRPYDRPGQMLEYIKRRRSHYNFGLLPLIVVGNLATAKVNSRGGFRGHERPLPGLTTEGLAAGFKAIRYFLNGGKPTTEGKDNKKLGDIVEAYITQAFADSSQEIYEIEDAPEGVVNTNNFAIKLGISRPTLDNILGEYGIDARSYRWGNTIGIGLTPKEQEEIIAMREEIQIDEAPKGYLSVSGFCIRSSVTKPRVDRLIDKHDVPTGRHRFRGRAAASLSPEAQQQLTELLFGK